MLRFLPVTLCVLFLSSCAKEAGVPAADAPIATVVMRDGTKVQGKVVESSPTQIRIATDDQQTRVIPMSTVKRVEYAEAKPAADAKAPADTKASASAKPAPEAEPPHEDHYHPPANAVTTKTDTLAVGTSVPVRVEETIDSGKAVEGQRFAAEVTRHKRCRRRRGDPARLQRANRDQV